MSISVVKCSWVKCGVVKCSEVLQYSGVLLVFYFYLFIYFYHCVYGCMLCILLFNSVGYVFLLLCLCILIVMYILFCTFCSHRANWHSRATLN